MKAQTALAIFAAAFAVAFLSFGFYSSAALQCGDEICPPGWICDPATSTCTSGGYCGDGTCGADEDSTSCPGDCGACDPPCSSGDVCQSGTCVPAPNSCGYPSPSTTGTVSGSGAPQACASASDCPSTAPRCLWGYCSKTNNRIEYTFDTGMVCVANAFKSYNSQRRRCDWATAPPCTTELFSLPLPASYKPECLYAVTITQLVADDFGEVCSGDCGAADGGDGGGGGNSFVAGTPIILADSNTKPIEKIKTGDIVQSFDPETGELSTGTVTWIMTRDVDEVYHIEFSDGSSVEATGKHPFYVKTAAPGVPTTHKYFVRAEDLRAGDTVYKASNGQAVQIKIASVQKISKHAKVYNFNVEPLHTYIANNMMVHNLKDGTVPAAAAVLNPTFPVTGFVTVASGSGSSSTPRDITNLITDKSNMQFRLRVTDMTAATRPTETTRSIGAQFKVQILNPSPTEKCVMNSTTNKPEIVPLCAGTTAECTQTPAENTSITAPRCVATSSLDNWFNRPNPTYKCVDSGNYKALVTLQEFRTHGCARQVLDPLLPQESSPNSYGSYNTSGYTVTRTRDNWTSRTYCSYGCVNGACRTVTPPPPCPTRPGNRVPTLTSITASPRRTSATGTINMTSVASDPDTVNGVREKIRLVCGMDEGHVVDGTTGGCPGTGGGTYTGQQPPNILADVQAERAKYGATICPDEAGEILNAVAWKNKDSGWGLSGKNFGNRCDSPAGEIACDILHHRPTNTLVDVFDSGPGSDPYSCEPAAPQWSVVGPPPGSNRPWLAPVQPSDTTTGSVTSSPTFIVTGLAAGDCNSVGPYTNKLGGFGNLRDCSINTVKYKAGRVFSNFQTPQVTDSVITMLNQAGLEASRGRSIDTINFAVSEGGATVGEIDVVKSAGANGAGEAWAWLPVTGGDGGDFVANLCTGQYADSNPTCSFTVPDEWKGGGYFRNLFCRVQDESGLYSAAGRTSIIVDNTPPTSQITSPAANSVQIGSFQVSVTDADDSGLGRCFYTAGSGAAKNRTCNSQFTVNVPGDCPQGTCTVSVYAKDIFGNTGRPDTRSFTIKIVVTNITSPEAGSYQSSNFSVSVLDRDFSNSNMACTYDVYSIGVASTKTVDNRQRTCNSNFTVSVGPDGDCRNIGQNTCRVVVRAASGTISDTSERFFSIDWVSPVSTISGAPTGWVNNDFTISVVDDPQDSQISECQYRVVSSGAETAAWRNRTCGISSPATITITAGNSSTKQCRHEGGEACTVFVRALGRGRAPGFGDNASVSVMFGNIDTNGFHMPLGALTTERGVNFSGTTRTELRAATFYVCNSRSSLQSCKAAYNSGNRGINSNNYCGAFGSNKCELRCSDQTVSFYFAAEGTPIGTVDTATVLSPISSVSCPVFNITAINTWLSKFKEVEQKLLIVIMEIDTRIRNNNESSIANNETLDIYNDALVLTKDHLNYMNVTMRDLTVAKAREILVRSEAVMNEINRILSGVIPPVRVRLDVNMPGTIRFNRTALLPFTVTKTGPRTAYANVYCSITMPNGTVLRSSTRQDNGAGCLVLENNVTTGLATPFLPSLLGQYGYSCTLGRSVRPDCSFEVNQTPVTGSFRALPALGTYIESISAPTTVLRGSSAVVAVTVNNPDEVEKFGNVSCSFTDPLTAVKQNFSECTQIDAGGTSTAQVKMIADRLGNWTVSRCQIRASEFSGCAGARLDNVSQQSANYTVAIPNDVFIESVTIPTAPVANGSLAFITVSVNNPTSSAAYVNTTCGLLAPYGRRSISGTAGMEPSSIRQFTLNITADAAGTWVVDNCTTYKSLHPDFSNQVVTYSVGNLGSFSVVPRTALLIGSVSVPNRVNNRTSAVVAVAVSNPSVTRYGSVSCVFRSPANVQFTNTSSCTLVDGTANMPVSIYLNKEGIWNVESCSLFGSVNPACTSASLHDRRLQLGTINSTPTGTGEVVCGDGQIGGSEQCDDGANNGACPATCSASCTINNCGGCAPGLYHAFNGTTGACAEFNSTCVPPGWVNRTAGPCNASNIYISAVSMPTVDVVNNTNADIGVTVRNPIGDDRFALVSCFVRNPSGASTLLTSTCQGIQANTSRNFATSVFANIAGTWTVTSCSVNASTSCSSAVWTHTFNAGRTFNVVRGLNISFVSFALPPDSLVNSTVQLSATVRNPSDAARFARVICSFRTPSNQLASNSTTCAQVAGTTTPALALSISANEAGSWSVEQCSLRAGLSDCGELHDTESGVGGFNITSMPPPPPPLLGLYVTNISAPTSAVNNSQINVVVYGRNPNTANSSYALTGCSFTSPSGSASRQISSCTQVTANSTQQFLVQQLASVHGTWTVAGCFINASATNNCAASVLHNVSVETRNVNVTIPPDLYITSVVAQEETVNNSDVPIDIFVSNPLNDDRYGTVSCIIEDPNGANQTRQAPCSSITRQNSRRYSVSVFADIVGTWNVRNCTVSAASNSACSGAAATNSMLNGDAFRVIRGYNLTISNIAVTSPAYTSTPIYASYTLRNPSASERFGRVACIFTKSGQSIINRSSCFTLPAESFIDSRANLTTEQAGTWTVTCNAERSADSTCSSLELHDTESRAFDVVNPPDLYIQSIDMPAVAPLSNLSVAMLRIRNTALTRFYGFAGCTFKNRLNETFRNASQCEELSQDTNNVAVGVIPELRGNWSVFNCFVNASRTQGCAINRTHNVSAVSKSFTVSAPLLRIEQVYLTSANLVVGDIADITVDVKNIGERDYFAFVNCTIFNPLNAAIKLTTANQTIPLDEIRTFHPQYVVDVPGRWRVSSCSVYRIGSIILEDTEPVNKQFNVTYIPPTEECNNNIPCDSGFICDNGRCVPEPVQCSVSNCPGVKDACYCSNNQCIGCGSGYTCSSGRCVTETPVNVCNSNSQCPSGQVCINSVCQPRPPECYQNSDCPASQECTDGRCVAKSEPISRDIMVLLIIILAIIMVPLILFIYIKKSM